jgi:dTDP-4-amino-4,6-dideoxy-D-galactose acyltransferase
MPNSSPDLCQLLPWDSDFFGVRIARVNGDRMTSEMMATALAWCDAHKVDCLYFLATTEDAETTRTVEQDRFQLVDMRITLETKLEPDTPTAMADSIRLYQAHDLKALKAIARYNHTDTRFYYDSHFDRAACDRLYEVWIEKSCLGDAQAVIVGNRGGAAVAYITCHIAADGTGKIGLVGVGQGYQGEGIGGGLVSGALAWFAQQGVSHITVVTQGRNVRAQRLYQRYGFITRSVQLWYHRWFNRQ